MSADIDHDGNIDLIVANEGMDNVTVFFQTAPGEFSPIVIDLDYVSGPPAPWGGRQPTPQMDDPP